MSILCKIFGHKWNGCRCKRCNAQSKNHKWKHCRCLVCGTYKSTGHNWNGCVCRVCGEERDIMHDLDGCFCKRCKKYIKKGKHNFKPINEYQEECTRCGLVQYYATVGAWENNYLRKILLHPKNFLYAAPNEKIICFVFPDDGGIAKVCFDARDGVSQEPDISIADFKKFVEATNKADMPIQIDDLFHYFAHTHNPKLGIEYAESFAHIHKLNKSLFLECYTFLVHFTKRQGYWSSADEIKEGRKADKDCEALQKRLSDFSTKVPTDIYNNILHLLAVKRNVLYFMNVEIDYGGVKEEKLYCSVNFGGTPQFAADILAKRHNPPYLIKAYKNFPKA